jgi:hypothetical protein
MDTVTYILNNNDRKIVYMVDGARPSYENDMYFSFNGNAYNMYEVDDNCTDTKCGDESFIVDFTKPITAHQRFDLFEHNFIVATDGGTNLNPGPRENTLGFTREEYADFVEYLRDNSMLDGEEGKEDEGKEGNEDDGNINAPVKTIVSDAIQKIAEALSKTRQAKVDVTSIASSIQKVANALQKGTEKEKNDGNAIDANSEQQEPRVDISESVTSIANSVNNATETKPSEPRVDISESVTSIANSVNNAIETKPSEPRVDISESVTSIAKSVNNAIETKPDSLNIAQSISGSLSSLSANISALAKPSPEEKGIPIEGYEEWEQYFSNGYNAPYFYNKIIQVPQWEHPKVDGFPGWEQRLDTKSGVYYYYNKDTQVTQWEHPKQIIDSVANSIGTPGSSISQLVSVNAHTSDKGESSESDEPQQSHVDKSQIANDILTVSQSINDMIKRPLVVEPQQPPIDKAQIASNILTVSQSINDMIKRPDEDGPQPVVDKSQISNAISMVSHSITAMMNQQSNKGDDAVIKEIEGGGLLACTFDHEKRDKFNNEKYDKEITAEICKKFITEVQSFVFETHTKLNSLAATNMINLYNQSSYAQNFIKSFVDCIMLDLTPLSNTYVNVNDEYVKYFNLSNKNDVLKKRSVPVKALHIKLPIHITALLGKTVVVIPKIINSLFHNNLYAQNKEYNTYHIMNIISLISILVNQSTTQIALTENINDNKSGGIGYIYLNKIMQTTKIKMYQCNELFQKMTTNMNNNILFNEGLSKIIKEQSSDKIQTIIKMTKHNDNPYNTRYKPIVYNTKKTAFCLTYNGTDDGYTQNNKPTYVYGKFDKILLPEDNNKTASQSIYNDILPLAQAGKIIMYAGYGVSGSGKTSTLIYLNNNGKEEEGILVELCNLFATKDNLKQMTVDICEFSDTDIKGKGPGTFNFIFNGSDFTLEHDGRKLSEVLFEYVDAQRKIWATTNNPNSSRSHVVIYVHITGDTKGELNDVKLVFCDFAGVENKLACESINMQKAFLDLEKDKSTIELEGGGKILSKVKIGDYVEYIGSESVEYLARVIDNTIQNDTITVLNLQRNGMNINLKLTDIKPYYYAFSDITGFKEGYNVMLHDDMNKNTELVIKNMQEYVINVSSSKTKLTRTYIYDPNLPIYKAILSSSSENYITISDAQFKLNDENALKRYANMKDTRKTESDMKTQCASLVKNTYKTKLINFIEQNDSTLYEDLIKFVKPWYAKNKQFPWIDTHCMFNMKDFGESLPDIDKTINKNIKDYISDEMVTLLGETEGAQLRLIFKGLEVANCYNSSYNSQLYAPQLNGTKSTRFNSYKNFKSLIIWMTELKRSYAKAVNLIKLYSDEIQLNKTTVNTCNENKGIMDVLGKMKEQCNIRLTEGNYINGSLATLRGDIRQILIQKNKDLIYYAPDFIAQCLPDYCPNTANCFDMTSKHNELDIKSDILKWIYEKCKNGNDDQTFYDNLVIGILCVFNITGTDKPPAQPYIDINQLKKNWSVIEGLMKFEKINRAVTPNYNLNTENKAQNDTLEKNKKESDAKINTNLENIQETNQKLEQLTENQNTKQQQNNNLQSKSKELLKKKEELIVNIKKIYRDAIDENIMDKLQARRIQIQTDISRSTTSITNINAAIIRLTDSLNNKNLNQTQIDKYKTVIMEQKKKVQKEEDTIRRSTTVRENVDNVIKLATEIKQLDAEIKQLDAEIKQLDAEIKKLNVEIKKLDDEIKKLNADIDTSHANILKPTDNSVKNEVKPYEPLEKQIVDLYENLNAINITIKSYSTKTNELQSLLKSYSIFAIDNVNIDGGILKAGNVKLKDTVPNIIDIIDKFNATSVLGSLDFIDQFAKLNTTNVTCSSESILDIKELSVTLL